MDRDLRPCGSPAADPGAGPLTMCKVDGEAGSLPWTKNSSQAQGRRQRKMSTTCQLGPSASTGKGSGVAPGRWTLAKGLCRPAFLPCPQWLLWPTGPLPHSNGGAVALALPSPTSVADLWTRPSEAPERTLKTIQELQPLV